MRLTSQLQAALFFILLFLCFSVNAESKLPAVPGDQLKLGEVSLTTSTTSPAAEAHFLMGLRYLHNFMYPLALREFKLANQYDPNFALSYWGMAMCYNWSLWSYENKIAGKKVMDQFNALKNVRMTPLEEGLMNAVAMLYQPGTVLENEKKYLDAMAQLNQQFPNNPDIAAFYALALIEHATDTPFDPNAKRELQTARDILKPFLFIYPGHPGIIHYYIHANDVPNSEFPETALSVTQNVYDSMSDSSHVLHMPSHLYTDLGRWQDAAYANELSIQASHRMCEFLESQHIKLNALNALDISTYDPTQDQNASWDTRDRFACDADNVYHSLEWLQYEYLQMGQFKKARALVDQMRQVADLEQDAKYYFWFYRMKARQILYSQSYKPVKALPENMIEDADDKHWAGYSECGLLLADGLRAIHNNQTYFLDRINSRFEDIIYQLNAPSGIAFKKSCQLAQRELAAATAFLLDDEKSRGLKSLNRALDIQYNLQSSEEPLTLPFIPAQEMYADFLLQDPLAKNLAQAVQLYTNELKFNPNRTEAILGLARAQAKLGNVNLAIQWYKKFLTQYAKSDAVATVVEAKTYIKNNPAVKNAK